RAEGHRAQDRRTRIEIDHGGHFARHDVRAAEHERGRRNRDRARGGRGRSAAASDLHGTGRGIGVQRLNWSAADCAKVASLDGLVSGPGAHISLVSWARGRAEGRLHPNLTRAPTRIHRSAVAMATLSSYGSTSTGVDAARVL